VAIHEGHHDTDGVEVAMLDNAADEDDTVQDADAVEVVVEKVVVCILLLPEVADDDTEQHL